ncbi:MAG: glutamine-synthetase adenylyltransferase [Paracoccaceae bacterium]
MTLADRITRHPIPFDGTAARDCLADLPGLPGEAAALVEGTAGCSPFLRDVMLRDPDWLRLTLSSRPEVLFDDILASLSGLGVDVLPDALRQAKRRVALLVALCDLGGVWPLETVTGALTRLADTAVDLSIRGLTMAEARRGRIPGLAGDDAAANPGMVALAMGKMGAAELNYSSDIDLICLFDETRFDPDDQAEARAAYVRITRRMTAMLSDNTAGGYVFRTDLRLRPDASVTPVCISTGAAEHYYEAHGRTWERAAYIKARPCGGDLAVGEGFLATLVPFVWRKHLDFAAIQDAHDMRLRIRDHKGLHGPLVVEGHDLKLGQGGIRTVEFFAQTRQLIAGGRDPSLRDRTTVGALAALAAADWVPSRVSERLAGHYRILREWEHRLQMVNDAQIHAMPSSAEGIARIAAFSGMSEAAFRRDLLERLQDVTEQTEGFFAPAAVAEGPVLTGPQTDIVEGWRALPALRSTRATESFKRLRPVILERLMAAQNPDEALRAFDGFLRGLPAGVQLFALFEANPQLVELIVDIVSTSPALAQYLSRNSGVLDAVIGGGFFAPWPGAAALEQALSGQMANLADYERKLDQARRWMKEWHFRIGVHHLRGLMGAEEAGRAYADLAQAVVAALWPVVGQELARKHGVAPGRGAVVLGMGSLGAARLNAGSDLDLIVIYDAAGVETSDGDRPLATRPWYARLTQALVTALSAPMAEGRLYEVDMRLRPSGRQGPVATSLQGFRDYQMNEAWTWEHLALTRARVIAGPPDLAAEVEDIRRATLAAKADRVTVLPAVAEMRARIGAAKAPSGDWDAKIGSGRMMELELFAQAATLIAASPARGIAAQIGLGPGCGLFTTTERDDLARALRLYWSLHAATRLLTPHALDMDKVGEGGRAFLFRETGMTDAGALASALHQTSKRVSDIIGSALGSGGMVDDDREQ